MSNQDTDRAAADLLQAVCDAFASPLSQTACLARVREIVGESPKGRKIVQISASAVPPYESAHPSCFAVYALCDDGSLWTQAMAEKEWFRLPDIPQDTPAESPDPIAELEALGGRLFGGHIPDQGNDVRWYLNGRGESAGNGASISDIRAAAARLLARVRGGAK